ncbi:polar amino acid transport system substrate-binding protein [Amycolatopsis tolypomycina]|uniref:Polar amino acid transport system substrate-binding protein n=1 Tax=Amycolatopsis tolypomycina TaxID=208445 RepID=A0A1H4Y0Y8_9PSEU|nr:transporter substrate-binding domain-containing protein [Amycolatopsis tolypomycina]SED11355.1 polar amino acid transport system substrate-binding protein [Amycolatopsis tolypomycina]
MRSFLIAAACGLLLAGCGGGGSAAGNPYGLIEPGTIRAATQTSQPPFAFGDPSGKPAGFVIDLTDEAAKRLGLKVEYKSTSVTASLAGLTSRQYDLAAAGLGVTEERQKSVSFTKPLFWSTTAVLTTAQSSASKLTDFAGKKVGAVTGSTQEPFVPAKLPGAVPIGFPNANAAVSQLLNGSLDAFVVGGPDAEHFLKQYPVLRQAASAPVAHPTSMAVPKDHGALLTALDKQLGAMVADGTYARLYRKYFTTAPLPQLVAAWPDLGAQFAGGL